ncbi:MAG: hypothetical protein F6K42_08510 [Leptolyngbya sp. SIO1D8]|nr:hypothetical protein [Leptolyngbya sp. SIO1D8]
MNFGTPVPLLIGIVLILGAVALFFLDKFKPGYGRDSDKVYAVLWLISGFFLIGHLTMELLPSFQQLIMAGMLIALTIENILLRTPTNDRYASQNADAPTRGEPYRPSRPAGYRSSSRMNVRAELENDDPRERRFQAERRALSGHEEQLTRRPSYYEDDYPDRYRDDREYDSRSNSPSERPVGRLAPSSDRIRRRRPKSVEGRYGDNNSDNSWDESPSRYNSSAGGYSSHSSPSPSPRNGSDADSYVDYRPVDYPDDEPNKPSTDYGGRY